MRVTMLGSFCILPLPVRVRYFLLTSHPTAFRVLVAWLN